MTVTEAQLDLALQIVSSLEPDEIENEHSRFHIVGLRAYETIVQYIAEEAEDNDEYIDEEILENKFKTMITQVTLDNMVTKGFLEANLDDNGEEQFVLTELGKMAAQSIKNDD